MDELLKVILNKYQIIPQKALPPQMGYRNRSFIIENINKELLNLIIYKRENGILEKIQNAHKIANILDLSKIPVRKPLGKILKLKVNYYACIYNYLPGNTIPWEAYTMDHLKLLGETLNKIHYTLSNLELDPNFPLETNNLAIIIDKMEDYFRLEGVQNTLRSKLKINLNIDKFINHSRKILHKLDKSLDKTYLHMDFVRGNILFQENSKLYISGIIDFEKTSYGSPLFELARTLAFLIVDCKYKSEDEIRKYFLKSGYIKKGKYKLKSYKYLNDLVMLYLIYDFYKFLKHNPYESLEENKHFYRTLEIILKLNLINSSN